MKNELNILHISPNFNLVCGVSKYVYMILKELKSFQGGHKLNLFFITNGGDSLNRLEDIGIKPYIMKFEKGLKNIFYIIKNFNKLKNFCIDNNINIIHTHHRYPEFLANLLKKKLDIKTVTTVHSLVEGFKGLSFKSDKIIAVSKTVEKNLINNYKVDKSKIAQIYNPIDWDDYKRKDENSDRSKIGISDTAKVFLFVGRWSKVKGVDILIQVFSEIFEVHNDIILILITDVSEKTKQKIITKSKNFIFVKPQNDISYFYRISDFVILPSRKDSFPYVMLETGVYEKIFVGSNVGGIAEFIENEKNGFLFNPNAEEFFKTITKVISIDESKKNIIVENLHRKVLSIDNVQTYFDKLLKIYNSL
jgi:glycosyltransferase involved in cell wall biosynthesis